MSHKSGFINIIGSPNVGKSTLMNALVGERLSIITSKAQTTRHRIMGIVSDENYQVIFSDTPGILEPAYKLQEGMMNFVQGAMQDADIFLVMTEIGETKFRNEKILNALQQTEVPVVVLINKIDLSNQEEVEGVVDHWQEVFPKARVLPISALKQFQTAELFQLLLKMLPEAPAYYPKDELTDKPERFFISEIIREKLLLHYKKEIPYSCEVVIEAFKEEADIVRIRAEIMVARDSQKGILIGHKGSRLKRVGTEARKDAEAFLGKKVFLELYVKVNKDWRNQENQLKRYGYLH